MDYRVYGIPLMQVNEKHNIYETITAQGNVLYHKSVPLFSNLVRDFFNKRKANRLKTVAPQRFFFLCNL